MVSDLRNLIRNKSRNMKLSQETIATELHITQSAYSKRLENMSFDVADLIRIFHLLMFTEEEISKNLYHRG